MPEDFGRKIRMDPRMVRKIDRSPAMSAEQGPDWLAGWGGATRYQELAYSPQAERMTYLAYEAGYTTPSEIEVVTGLRPQEVSSALAILRGRGDINRAEMF